jgi:hypothetical protein
MDSDIHLRRGVSALLLAYKGSVGYLKPEKLLSLIGYKKIIIGI